MARRGKGQEFEGISQEEWEKQQQAQLREDMDSLFCVPLSILPLETPSLRRARMIKNVKLESAIEVFSDRESGSGQLGVEDLQNEYDWPDDRTHPDLVILRKLSMLSSYDVYSLRILLREHGIPVNDDVQLKLSDDRSRQLTNYMRRFTTPLLMQIYGDGDADIQEFQDVINLFRDPDVRKAREKLQMMADKLEIDLMEIPKFLEDYGDIFLSLSYYRNCLDRILPIVNECMDSMTDIRSNWQLRNDPALMKTCTMVEGTINNTTSAISGRFESFGRHSQQMWDNITAEKFRRVKLMIESYHTSIGGVLCGLTVKMITWKRLFPEPELGGPVRRSEFIMSEMKQGIDKMRRIEENVPTSVS